MKRSAARRHQLREAKAARRRARLKKETPGKRKARELRLLDVQAEGARRMFRMVEQPKPKAEKKPKPKRRRRRRGVENLDPDRRVPIPCQCKPQRQHGPHWVEARRLQKGGDLRGKVRIDPVAMEMLEAA